MKHDHYFHSKLFALATSFSFCIVDWCHKYQTSNHLIFKVFDLRLIKFLLYKNPKQQQWHKFLAAIPKYDEQIKIWIQTACHCVFIYFVQNSQNQQQKCFKLFLEIEPKNIYVFSDSSPFPLTITLKTRFWLSL